MKFHKKLGVFEACKKVRKDFFDTLKKSAWCENTMQIFLFIQYSSASFDRVFDISIALSLTRMGLLSLTT